VKAVVYDRYGPPDLLWVEDVPTPTPSAGQVLDRARHAVLRVHRPHRRRRHRQRRGAARPRPRPADGGRGRGLGGRRGGGRSAARGVVEIAGPEAFRLDELLRRRLADRGDPREVVADPAARYFDAGLDERTLVTGEGARLGATHLDRWLEASAT
jgi:hypothetical protein